MFHYGARSLGLTAQTALNACKKKAEEETLSLKKKQQRQREAVDDETKNVNIIKSKEVSDSDRHATNYDDEWLTVNA